MTRRLVVLLVVSGLGLQARTVFVSPEGSDRATGTQEQPFQTIQRGVEGLEPGDCCLVRAGFYRETVTLRRSGEKDRPIRIEAYPGEIVVFEGTDPVPGPWEHVRGHIYRTRTDKTIEQLFVNRQMMMEARWPNTTFENQFSREGWATTGPESEYQVLQDPELADTGIDWTGATAFLNVAHQFWTWSRPVLNHSAGSDRFEYRIEMNPFHTENRRWWHDDYYYLIGRLEALDAETEWFLSEDGWLYLWAPGGGHPGNMTVAAKQRHYGIVGNGISHVVLSGFHFFGCTFELTDVQHCTVSHCNLRFPSFDRGIPDAETPRRPAHGTRLIGNDNVVRSCSLAHGSNWGIKTRGKRNLVENCLIYDVNWTGTLRYTGIALGGIGSDERSENVARYCTVYNVGNAIINSPGNRYGVIEYCHVHHGGMICKDISLLYTATTGAMGQEWRYNWVHDSLSPGHSLGMRGDDKTRGLYIHHNVVWNIANDGIITKGGKNRVYNNTCLWNGASDIHFNSGREPDKWWQEHIEAYEHQNEDSLLINNCARVIVSTRRAIDPGLPGDHSNNYTEGDPRFVDPVNLDFRPREDSPLIDAGRAVPGVTAPFEGAAPDIGAYEFAGERWLPGHRNGLCVTRGEEGLQVALNLPVSQSATVTVAQEGDRRLMVFGADNWMIPQPLGFENETDAEMVFSCTGWGSVQLQDPESIRQLAERRLRFPKPDLSSAKTANPKFHYETVYQRPELENAQARAFYTESPIRIDGIPQDDEWVGRSPERSLRLTSLNARDEQIIPDAGTADLLFDDNALYVAFRLTAPGVALLKEGGEWGPNGTDGVEIDIRPVGRERSGPTFVCHGYPSGAFESVTLAGAPVDKAAELARGIDYAAHIDQQGRWSCEWRIPFAAMGTPLEMLQHVFLNVGTRRNGAEGGPWFAAAKTGGANYDVGRALTLRLDRRVRAAADNLVRNGRFEQEEMSPWTLASNSRESLPEQVLSRIEAGTQGNWCVVLAAEDADMMQERVLKWLHPLDASVVPGDYCLSYDVKLDNLVPRGAMGSFNSYIRTGRNIGQQESVLTYRRTPWMRRDFILTVEEGETPSFISLQLHRATGTVFIDNVSLIRLEPEP